MDQEEFPTSDVTYVSSADEWRCCYRSANSSLDCRSPSDNATAGIKGAPSSVEPASIRTIHPTSQSFSSFRPSTQTSAHLPPSKGSLDTEPRVELDSTASHTAAPSTTLESPLQTLMLKQSSFAQSSSVRPAEFAKDVGIGIASALIIMIVMGGCFCIYYCYWHCQLANRISPLTRNSATVNGEGTLGFDRRFRSRDSRPPTLSVRISTMPLDFASIFWPRASELDNGRRSEIELDAVSPVELDGRDPGC